MAEDDQSAQNGIIVHLRATVGYGFLRAIGRTVGNRANRLTLRHLIGRFSQRSFQWLGEMFNKFAAALALAWVSAGPSQALTLGFGVELEPFPVLSSAGPTYWYNNSVVSDGFEGTEFEILLQDLGSILTSPTTLLDVTDVDGWFNLSFSPGPSGLFVTGSLTATLVNQVTVGPVTIPFPQELLALVTDVEFDLLSPFGPTVNVLMDVIPIATTQFFTNLFGEKLFASIVLDNVDIGPSEFDRSLLFDPSANDIGAAGVTGFFSMYRVKQTSGGGDGDGDGGPDDGDISPVPLPASVPLLLAALGAFAWVRRTA